MMATPNAYWKIGLSGTPLSRTDSKNLLVVAATGPVIYKIEAEKLIDAGWMSRPKIVMVEVFQDSDLPTYQGVYGALITRSSARNKVIGDLAERADKPCLVFVKEISHGARVAKEISCRGIRCEFLSGTNASEQRLAANKRLVRGDIDVLVASAIYNQGVDIPDLRSLVVAGAGKSSIVTLQRLGRGLRVADGKDTVQVFDIYDVGTHVAGKAPVLEKHAKTRASDYSNDYEVKRVTSVDEAFAP